jgi:hypothetical protein
LHGELPADLRKLLEWLDRVSPLLEAQIIAAGFNQTLDKALMRNFVEMNLREATVSITARGRDALSVMRRRPSPRNTVLLDPIRSDSGRPQGPGGTFHGNLSVR